MRAGEKTALLLANADTDKIYLVGRWRSDAMLCYLNTSVQTSTAGLTERMVHHGEYALIQPAHLDYQSLSTCLGLS